MKNFDRVFIKEEIGIKLLSENYSRLKTAIIKNELLQAGMEFMSHYNREREILYIPSDGEGRGRYFVGIDG